MRLAIGAAIGLAVGVIVGAALGIHAQQEPDVEIGDAVACKRGVGCTDNPALLDQVVEVAEEAGVDATDLLGAANTTGLAPRDYLVAVGELAAPESLQPAAAASSSDWPFYGPIGQRIYCVEGIESSHGRSMYNPRGWPPPLFNEHAQGWLGWLPSTARRWGVAIGDRASEWDGARRMIQAGAGSRFFGIAAGRC